MYMSELLSKLAAGWVKILLFHPGVAQGSSREFKLRPILAKILK